MKHEIELVIFDMAGTTIKDDGSVSNAFKLALQSHGYSVPEKEIKLLMGYKKTQAIEILLNTYEPERNKISLELIYNIHHTFLEIMVNYYSTTTALSPSDGAEEVFARLKEQNIKVAL